VSTKPLESPPPLETSDVSPIENEIPTYRAISALAVVSLLLGLASVLCFADSTFYLAAVFAVVVGVWAMARIKRLPDVLTGRRFAQAGITFAVMFSLSSVTVAFVQHWLRVQGAEAFVKDYVKVLNTRRLADAVWYKLPPPARKGRTPKDALDDIQKQSRDPAMLNSQTGTLSAVFDKLKNADRHLEFVKIEVDGLDGLTPYAAALLKVDGPEDPKAPNQTYALLQLKALEGDVKKGAWYVQEFSFPYTPSSFALKQAPVDDGHGHGGAGH
jgi:hypothetical protein